MNRKRLLLIGAVCIVVLYFLAPSKNTKYKPVEFHDVSIDYSAPTEGVRTVKCEGTMPGMIQPSIVKSIGGVPREKFSKIGKQENEFYTTKEEIDPNFTKLEKVCIVGNTIYNYGQPQNWVYFNYLSTVTNPFLPSVNEEIDVITEPLIILPVSYLLRSNWYHVNRDLLWHLWQFSELQQVPLEDSVMWYMPISDYPRQPAKEGECWLEYEDFINQATGPKSFYANSALTFFSEPQCFKEAYIFHFTQRTTEENSAKAPSISFMNYINYIINNLGVKTVANPTTPKLTLVLRRQRKLLNNNELFDMLRKEVGQYNGEAEMIYLEDYTFKQQLKIIRSTTIFVAVLGASNTWVSFMQPETSFIELDPVYPPPYDDFQQFAESAGVNFFRWKSDINHMRLDWENYRNENGELTYKGLDEEQRVEIMRKGMHCCSYDYFNFWALQDTIVDVGAVKNLLEKALTTGVHKSMSKQSKRT